MARAMDPNAHNSLDENDPERATRELLADSAVALEAAGTALKSRIFPDSTLSLTEHMNSDISGICYSLLDQLDTQFGLLLGNSQFKVSNSLQSDGSLFSPELVAFLYARVVEYQYHRNMIEYDSSQSFGSDYLRSKIESVEDAVSARAMSLLTAQSSFVYQMERAKFSLSELPADLLHELVWSVIDGLDTDAQVSVSELSEAGEKLLSGHDETDSRLAKWAQYHLSANTACSSFEDFVAMGPSCSFGALARQLDIEFDDLLIISALQDRSAFAMILYAAGIPEDGVQQTVSLLHIPGSFDFSVSKNGLLFLSAEQSAKSVSRYFKNDGPRR